MNIKIIEFTSLPGETSDLQSEFLFNLFEKHPSVQSKIIGLCADNTNTNFGGKKRKGMNNVWRKLQNKLGKDILGIGCAAHVVHNCLQTGVDCLPLEGLRSESL